MLPGSLSRALAGLIGRFQAEADARGLQAALVLARALAGGAAAGLSHDQTTGASNGAAQWACKGGLTDALLDTLAELGSPPPRGKGAPPPPPGAMGLYYGHRTDVLAGLACLAYDSAEVARRVEERGAVELMLSQCQVDDGSPLTREWGLFAVRNLCEASSTLRDHIRGMKAQGVVQTEEIDRLGLKVEIDPEGKVVVRKAMMPYEVRK